MKISEILYPPNFILLMYINFAHFTRNYLCN